MTITIAKKKIEPRWLALAAIVAVAAFFRLYELGMSALRADSILLWSVAERHVPPGLLITKWFEVSGAMGQMPMPAFIMQFFLSLIGWHVTPLTLRLTFAVFGILTVPVAFFAGRRLKGPLFGLVLAALLAVNSFHIATSREAYFYSTMVFGNFLLFWASVILVEKLWKGESLEWRDLVLLAAALFFCGYSQITGLIICGTGGLLFFGLVIYRRKTSSSFKRNLISIIAVYAVIFLPVVFAPWGLKPLLAQIGAAKAVADQNSAMGGLNLLTGLIQIVEQFSWGWTLPARILLVAVLLSAGYAFVKNRDVHAIWLAYFIVMQIILFSLSRTASGASYEARYLSGIFPFFLACVAYGILYFSDALSGRILPSSAVRAATGAFCAIAILPALYPAYLQTQLTGKPVPYFEISRWFDSNLPPNTPVLVDRWFEPWNELKVHPSTNVVYTFTIPNEPVDVFVKNRWRDTAKAFFAKYPDAAYLEIAKSYWEVPGVGPWEWPRQFFAHHVVITNEAGMKLRNLGLANRGDYYAPTTNRVVVEIFYNTREDILSKARAGGQTVIGLYGDGWNFTKTQDFRDWRVLEGDAVIDLYNLTSSPLTVQVTIRALAVNGSKQVRVSNGVLKTFAANQFVEWPIGNRKLAPGLTQLRISDPLWTMGHIPLVVDGFDVTVASPDVSPAAVGSRPP
jgi:hypothetical protein